MRHAQRLRVRFHRPGSAAPGLSSAHANGDWAACSAGLTLLRTYTRKIGCIHARMQAQRHVYPSLTLNSCSLSRNSILMA